MKLSVKGLAFAFAVLWGGGVMLLVGLANMYCGYGQPLLDLMATLYPGYSGGGSVGQLFIGVGYGVVDGFIGGGILAWVYNLCVPKGNRA